MARLSASSAALIGLLLLAGWDLGDQDSALRARGIPPESVVVAFEANEAIAALARQASEGAQDDVARAGRLYDVILRLKRQGIIEGDRDNTPKARPPKTAIQLQRVLDQPQQETADRKAGCYELSALYVAAARTLGLAAVGVERDEPSGTGQIGHVMAGVRFEAGGRLTIFDLQNESRRTRSRIRELDDMEFAAHHYNHLAVAAFLRGELSQARAAIDVALALASESPSFLNNRAIILAAQDEPVLAVAESIHAVELAPLVPLYRYQLGRLLLMSGDTARAIESFGHALQLRPSYGLARRDLGWAYLLEGRSNLAKQELIRARAKGSKTPDADLFLGLFYLAEGDTEAALEVVATALEKSPEDEGLHALRQLAMQERGGASVERLRRVLRSVDEARRVAGGVPLP